MQEQYAYIQQRLRASGVPRFTLQVGYIHPPHPENSGCLVWAMPSSELFSSQIFPRYDIRMARKELRPAVNY